MTLSVFQATITNENGDILPGAEVSVILESTGLAATIYSTRGGAALPNPFFADTSGFAQFYANAGEYRIIATSGVFSRTWRYVRLGDGGAKDVGTAATRDVGTATGNVLEFGALGIGNKFLPTLDLGSNTKVPNALRDEVGISGFYMSPVSNMNPVGYGYAKAIGYTDSSNSHGYQLIITFDGNLHSRSSSADGVSWNSYRMWSQKNTTVDGSGFIKSASPIVKLYADKIEANDYKEIEDCTFERVGAGHYIIKGAPRLSRDGWYIETLKDRNNNIYFTLDYEELEDGLHIRTYEPDYSTGRATNGAPVDINDGRFVTLRFEEDASLYPAPEEPEV